MAVRKGGNTVLDEDICSGSSLHLYAPFLDQQEPWTTVMLAGVLLLFLREAEAILAGLLT